MSTTLSRRSFIGAAGATAAVAAGAAGLTVARALTRPQRRPLP